jgi:16S rRNA (guanine1207-N2)-methyltransferase
MNQDCSLDERPPVIAPYPQEALLVDAVPQISGQRLLCTSPGLAQFAAAAARALPDAVVSCTYLDLYRATLAREHCGDSPPNLRIECAADLSADEADIVALPLSANGEAELTRDLLQSAHTRLRLSGKLFTTTNNQNDIWLDGQLCKLFRNVERRPSATGVLYVATKTEPLKKLKNFSCEFAFRDRGRLIRAFSRPGVFSHRHIDPGARHLIDTMEVAPGMRVLDIGCGAGTVALAAACRAENVHIHAVDSNARAIECTERGTALNDFPNITTELNATGNIAGAGTYDLALANPPYYAAHRITHHFLTAAHQSLRPGGTLVVVTKFPDWHREHMPAWFDDVTMIECKGYCVFRGSRAE